jgi:hypothetical protein
MEFNDKLGLIYRFFRIEFLNSSFSYYSDFLKSKDIGIIRIDNYVVDYRLEYNYWKYEIIDDKKWALSKIKYGI